VNTDHVEQDARSIPKTREERLASALPFTGSTETFEYGRNNLSYGSNFFQRGYYEEAAVFFDLALRDDPSSAEASYGLGSAYLNLQKTAEARESFERATRLGASYPDTLANAWNNLGLLAAREGQAEQSLGFFRKALQLNPNHPIALRNLGSAYRVLKRWDEAREAFLHALAIDPDDAEANYGLGMVYAQEDDTAHASDYLQKSLQARPAYPEALNNLGILYLRTRRRDEAVEKFEECMRVAPEFEQCYLTLAQVYALERTPDKARGVLTELLKRRPDDAAAKNMLEQLGR
jgi:tetratricopeptide (TPR) repeat protein